MVSLFNMVLERGQSFRHLTSLVPSLDSVLFDDIKGVYDLQAVPNCPGADYVLASIVTSHVAHSPSNQAIIVNLFNNFPLELILDHNAYTKTCQIKVETSINTITKLIAFCQKLARENNHQDTVLVLYDLHHLLDLYRLQLSKSYQRALLKNHYHNNDIIRLQKDRYVMEGASPNIVPIPAHSSLIKENPRTKYSHHVNFLFHLISQFCYANGLLVVIRGDADVSFQPYTPLSGSTATQTQSQARTQTPLVGSVDSQLPTSIPSSSGSMCAPGSHDWSHSTSNQSSGSRTRTRKLGRLVLRYSNTSIYEVGPQVKVQSNTLDSIITKRVMFYRDWYHKSPHFSQAAQANTLKQVFCARVDSHLKSIPVYFDLNDPCYYKPTRGPRSDLIDLSPNYKAENDLSRDILHEYPPSSPTMGQSLVRYHLQSQTYTSDVISEHDADSQNDDNRQHCEPSHNYVPDNDVSPEKNLIVEDSQDMGTPLLWF